MAFGEKSQDFKFLFTFEIPTNDKSYVCQNTPAIDKLFDLLVSRYDPNK